MDVEQGASSVRFVRTNPRALLRYTYSVGTKKKNVFLTPYSN